MSKLLTQLTSYRVFFYSNFHQVIHLRFHKLARFYDYNTNPKKYVNRSLRYEEGKRKHMKYYESKFKTRLVKARDFA
eukprot:CAMPEP_0170510398 /NCGR_PEP_ID=MMETSP0208-20121228/65744_1 /TAXON_ID=197538 /ORGANISM="Strombidium inclinatum, Strain S3" /LENGTH=76 /DNA_ID=CAMNT_0010793853 /DNA_START=2655 /DNA_END=2885 /DNA_ORIENTATION=-